MRTLIYVLALAAILLVSPAAAGDEPTTPNLNQSIFRLFLFSGERVTGGGSCVLTDKGLLTAYHCVEPIGKAYYKPRVRNRRPEVAGYVEGAVIDSFGVRRAIKSWERQGQKDLVILVLEGALPEKWAALKTAAVPKQGQPCRVVGFFGMSGFGRLDRAALVQSAGWLEGHMAVLTQRGLEKVILHSAPIFKGLSGAPLLDSEGRVIGINIWVGGPNLFSQSGASTL